MQLLTIDRLQLGITQIHFGLLIVVCTYKYGGMMVVYTRMVCTSTSTCTLILLSASCQFGGGTYCRQNPVADVYDNFGGRA